MEEIGIGTGEYFHKWKTNGRTEPEVLIRLRLEHLNREETLRKKTCTVYEDIFHLPGEILTSAAMIRHEIRTETGIEPGNVKP